MVLPEATAVTTPPMDTEDTEASAVDQTPPVAVVVNVEDIPVHMAAAPVMLPATGEGMIVIPAVVNAVPQPLVTVYVIVALPEVTPVISPVVLTVATAALLLLHVPPVVVLLKVILAPWHTDERPVIVPDAGFGLTLSVAVVMAEPQLLLST